MFWYYLTINLIDSYIVEFKLPILGKIILNTHFRAIEDLTVLSSSFRVKMYCFRLIIKISLKGKSPEDLTINHFFGKLDIPL
jgi:hypothetical protein